VGPVWKEWWREVLAGWRRKGMSCLVEGCGTGMKRGLTVGDVGRPSRKQWFWMLKNMHLVFSRLENRSCKKAFGD